MTGRYMLVEITRPALRVACHPKPEGRRVAETESAAWLFPPVYRRLRNPIILGESCKQEFLRGYCNIPASTAYLYVDLFREKPHGAGPEPTFREIHAEERP